MLCMLDAERSKDEAKWFHTSSLMALMANVNAKKGKSFSPADFNPYLKSMQQHDISTREKVLEFADKMKSLK